MLSGKTVVVGVCGGIASYKMANCVSMLKKLNADVYVVMTKNAANFISPITFETLTGHKCLIETFDRNFEFHVEHVSLGKRADIMLIAPATANVIGKIANGIADDMLTTTTMAMRCKVIISPAMNTTMFNNPIVQDNITKLKHFGYTIIQPDSGYLACGDEGDGKMPEESLLIEYILQEIAYKKDMAGLNVIISAGPTQEAFDPVRYISNHSTGKMGYELAKVATRRGAKVTLVSGKTNLKPPAFVETINVISAQDMFEAFERNFRTNDIIIKAAAVADYRPAIVANDKIKKKDEDMSFKTTKNIDIIKYMGENRVEGQYICGFSMETENMIKNSKEKLKKKNIDMIVANNLKQEGAGFGTNTNIVTIITKKDEDQLELMTKEEVANIILTKIINNMERE